MPRRRAGARAPGRGRPPPRRARGSMGERERAEGLPALGDAEEERAEDLVLRRVVLVEPVVVVALGHEAVRVTRDDPVHDDRVEGLARVGDHVADRVGVRRTQDREVTGLRTGSMLTPWVVTYVVPPPSDAGQKNHTAASTSAARALMLAALVAACHGGAPLPAGQGGRGGRPARSEERLLDHRETDAVEVLEVAGRDRQVIAGHHDVRASRRLDRCRRTGVPTTEPASLRVMVAVLPVRFVVEVNSIDVDEGAVRGVRDVVDVGHGRTGDRGLAVSRRRWRARCCWR